MNSPPQTLSAFGIVALMATTALAQVPPMLHYQARIASDGQAITPETTVAFAFQLLDPVTGNQILWRSYPLAAGDPVDGGGFDSENLLPVEVRNGQTSVLLGSGGAPNLNEPIPLDPVFFDPDAGTTRFGVRLRAWMSLDGGALVRLEPDIEFASVPYAMTAGFAETVADASVTPAKLTNDTLGLTIPTGTVLPFAGGTVPDGWVLCDARILDATDEQFAALAETIGTAFNFGDEPVGHFRVPDMRGRTAIGTGKGDTWIPDYGLNESTNWLRGQKFGSERHRLSAAEMPAHAHLIPTGSSSGTGNALVQAASANRSPRSTQSSTGQERPFIIMQPSLVLNYIIKL